MILSYIYSLFAGMIFSLICLSFFYLDYSDLFFGSIVILVIGIIVKKFCLSINIDGSKKKTKKTKRLLIFSSKFLYRFINKYYWLFDSKITTSLLIFFTIGFVYIIVSFRMVDITTISHLNPAFIGKSIDNSDLNYHSKKFLDRDNYKIVKLSLSLSLAIVFDKSTERYYIKRSVNCTNSNNHIIYVNFETVSCSKDLQTKHTLSKTIKNKLYQIFAIDLSISNGFIYSVLTSDKSYLHPSHKAVLRHLGLMHISAVSGFHFAIVLAILQMIFF